MDAETSTPAGWYTRRARSAKQGLAVQMPLPAGSTRQQAQLRESFQPLSQPTRVSFLRGHDALQRGGKRRLIPIAVQERHQEPLALVQAHEGVPQGAHEIPAAAGLKTGQRTGPRPLAGLRD